MNQSSLQYNPKIRNKDVKDRKELRKQIEKTISE